MPSTMAARRQGMAALLLVALAMGHPAAGQVVEHATAAHVPGAAAVDHHVAQPAAAVLPMPSPHFGLAGELWRPDGPFMDFSYAGYKYGDVEPPTAEQAPVTKWLTDFLRPGVTHTQAILDLVAWGNAQPPSAGWVVLGLPPGAFTLEKQAVVSRSNTILRGAGRDRTWLYLPNSMTDLFGKCKDTGEGYWVWTGALVTAKGPKQRQAVLAKVDASTTVPRGSYTLKVNSTAKLAVGQIVGLHYNGGNGALAREIMNNHLDPGNKYGKYDALFTSRIRSISGQFVTLERAVPWRVQAEFNPELILWQAPLHDVGFEGFTMQFKHTKYLGHHKELGMGGVEFVNVEDGWARDLRFLNSDNGAMVAYSDRVTVSGIEVAVTRPRAGPPEGPQDISADGHWGVRVGNSRDILVRNVSIQAHMMHSLGADSHALFSVFERAAMRAGSVEMHRAQSAQVLFTDIDVGLPLHSFYNGGPATSGPNAGAFTTYWNIRSSTGVHRPPDHSHNAGKAGDCSFGPDLSFIGVTFTGPICRTWVYQPGLATPPNLYEAQLARRRPQNQVGMAVALGAAAPSPQPAATAGSLEEGPATEPAPAPEPAALQQWPQWAEDAAPAPATV